MMVRRNGMEYIKLNFFVLLAKAVVAIFRRINPGIREPLYSY